MASQLSPTAITQALSDLEKAITSTSVSNGALTREDLQSNLVVSAPRETPLRNRFNRIAGNGNAHAFFRMKANTDKSKGIFFGTTPGNGVFPNGGLPTAAVELYDRVSTPYANIGDVAQVTMQDQAQGRSFTDLMAQRERVKAINAAMIEEYFILWGDSTVSQSGGGFIFDGLIKQTANLGGALEAAPNGQISLGAIRQLQYQQWVNGGQPSCIVMDGLAKAILTADVMQFFNLNQTGAGSTFSSTSGGTSVKAWDFGYGEVDWIVNRYLVPDAYTGQSYLLSLDDVSMDTKNDGNVIQMVDVDAMHSLDLAIVDTSWKKAVFETTSLMVSCPNFQGMITGLTYAGQSPVTG